MESNKTFCTICGQEYCICGVIPTWPLYQAVLCPVCNGSGKYSPVGLSNTTTEVCHGCNGLGWVKV